MMRNLNGFFELPGKKGCLLVAAGFFAMIANSIAQDSLYFKGYNIVGENSFDCSGRLIQTADSIYEVVCIERTATEMGASVRVTKLNLEGTVFWSQKITTNKTLWFPSVCAAPDSGSLVCCSSWYDTTTHDYTINLIKLNSAGTIQWTVSMNTLTANYYLQDYCIGNSFYFSYISDDLTKYTVIKFSSDGTLIWNRQFSAGSGTLYSGAGTVSSDHKIILTSSFDSGYNGHGLFVLTIDTNGDVLSGKRFSGEYHNPHACMVDLSGDVVIAGTMGTEYGTFTKVSKQGDLIFHKKVEFGINYDEIWDVLQTPDSSYYLIAEPESYISKSQAGILKFDKEGNFLWMKIYGGSHGSFPFNGVLNGDSTITVAGTLDSYTGSGDLWLLKVDADGNSSCAAKSKVPDITEIVLIPDSGYTSDSIVPFGSLMFTLQLYSTQSYDVCDTIALTVNFIQKNDNQLELPTFFSPNGLNPFWQIMNEQPVHSINIILSDIYGKIRFQSNDPQFRWNGTANGIAVPSGMYCWTALVNFDNSNERKILSGKLILVK